MVVLWRSGSGRATAPQLNFGQDDISFLQNYANLLAAARDETRGTDAVSRLATRAGAS